jgi:glycosyltransferase involved in cell wall biosynthesis
MKLVTVAIPIYKRLSYLPQALKYVESQDYPRIELIVSDNGNNGSAVPEVVDAYYSRPYRFRQNLSTVSISTHWNQIIHEASGDFFVILCDDDEISPNYVSELVRRLERHPSANAAISSQELIGESGITVRRSKPGLPDIVSGTDFIWAAWHTHEYRFGSFTTIMARTQNIRSCGGYPDFTTGTHNDDALLIKLCLPGDVVFSDRCCFRKRMYETSHGMSISIRDLGKASQEFLQFLDSDPTILEFTRHYPDRWVTAKRCLVELGWKTYYRRWARLYRRRLTTKEWIHAAFAMPLILPYYQRVLFTLWGAGKSTLVGPIKKFFPRAYQLYKIARYGRTPLS